MITVRFLLDPVVRIRWAACIVIAVALSAHARNHGMLREGSAIGARCIQHALVGVMDQPRVWGSKWTITTAMRACLAKPRGMARVVFTCF